jgi:hypothetical protein
VSEVVSNVIDEQEAIENATQEKCGCGKPKPRPVSRSNGTANLGQALVTSPVETVDLAKLNYMLQIIIGLLNQILNHVSEK